MFRFTLFLLLSSCTLPPAEDSADIDDSSDSLESEWTFVDDCDEGLNDSLNEAVSLPAKNETLIEDAQLCSKEVDYYYVDIPAGKWLSVEIVIDGTGKGKQDLDLFELENPDAAIDPRLDVYGDEDPDNILWISATTQPYERLAWYNPGPETMRRYLAVDGYKKSEALYNIDIRTSKFHDGLDCDDFFNNSKETGPCNRVIQFPQANTVDDGYLVTHWTHYSNLRREVVYLVRYGAEATMAYFPDTNPLALMDMSEDDGDTPGRMENQLRHPEGTHANGNDIDIAYYQTGSNNHGRAVCPQNDGYFCTGAPTLLDAERTAYFMVRLMDSKHLRVIGVDPKIATEIFAAADDLKDQGVITKQERTQLGNSLAYGDGWPFHHHHMHFSWDFESGFEESKMPSCLLAPPDRDEPKKVRRGPGLD